MAMSNELFLAVLAMDAYNRQYNSGIGDPVTGLTGTSIGNASIGIFRADTSASFFAQSYTWNGQTIISYRGTDQPAPLSLSGDILNGYWTAGGDLLDPEARLAIEFYKQVVAQYGNNVTLTGHSMGAGQAGLVAAIFNRPGILFDNMPFQLAAERLYQLTQDPIGAGPVLPLGLSAEQIQALVYGSATPWAPTFGQISNYYIPHYGIGPQTNWLDFIRGTLGGLAGIHQTITSTELSFPSDVPLGWTQFNKIGQRHDATLLVMRMFFDSAQATGDWQYAAKHFLPLLFDQTFAGSISGAAALIGPGAPNDAANAVRSALAYSVIDEGNRIFGDTGIRALLNDATDLGSVLKAAGASTTLKSSGDALGKIMTQFAGQLAVNKVMQSSTTVPVTDGVISVSPDGQTLAVDFGDQLWSVGSSSPTAPENIVGRKDLTDAVFKQTNGIFEGTPGHPTPSNDIRAGMKWLWNDDNSSVIDRFVFATTNDALTATLPNRSSSSTKVSLFAAGGQNDTITGSRDNDFIFGGNGNDTLKGGDGDDLLAGGKGDDRMNGGAGRNFLTGGEGKDTVFYETSGEAGIRLNGAGITDTVSGGPKILQLTTAFGGPVDRVVVEKVELTNKPDTLIVDREALKADVEIDMRESNRQASQSNLDVYDLSNVGQGLTYRSGKVAFGWAGPLSSFIGLAENLEVKNADKIILTDFNDTVVSANFGNIIHTGKGADKIWIGSDGVAIDDLSKDDRLMLAGVIPLFGGIRNGNKQDNPYGYSWGGAVRWAEDVSGALQVSLFGGPTTYILNWGADSAGKTVDERPGRISLFTATFEGVYRLVDGLPSNASIMGWWDLFGALVKTMTGLEVWKGVDPLTLDLDGDGLELTGPNSLSASFDFNADGYAERAGWVRPDDGILVRDVNGNGRIDNVTEMFGGASSGFVQLAALDGNHDGKVDANDNGLADFNGDGTVDANDTIDALKIWRDLNEDGVTQEGELFSFADLGIASISVTGTAQQDLFEAGNQITATGTFTRTDGSTGTIADVLYRVDNAYTQYAGDPITITAHAAALPDHKGHGTLVSLREAMSLDDDFAILVEDTLPTLSSLDLGALRAEALPILLGWAVASPLTDGDGNPNTNPPKLLPHDDVHILVKHDQFGGESVVDYAYQTSATVGGQTVSYWALGSGRPVVDSEGVTLTHPTLGQVLAAPQTLGDWTLLDGDMISFVERYIGEALPVDRVIPAGTVVSPGTIDIFNTILSTTNLAAVRIAVQDGPLSPFFASMDYDAAGNTFHPAAGNDRQLIPVFEAIFNEAIAQNHNAAWLSEWKPMLDVITGDYVRGKSFLSMSYAFLAQNIVAAYESTGIAMPFEGVASAFGIPDDLIISGSGTLTGTTDADILYAGTASNDTLRGGEGPDTYVFGHIIGHDTIDDIEPALTADHVPDTIRFASLGHDDVTATRNGNDLILTVNATGETVTVLRQFEGYRPGLFGGDISDETGVADIVFADGVSWDLQDIAKAVSHPLASDDTIVGTPSIDWLDGGAGNDHLSGGDDGDVYVFDRGYGDDVVQEAQTNILINTWDIVRFGEGITLDDVTFSRDGNSPDLLITINDTSDSLTVAGQFVANYTLVFDPNWFQRIEYFIFDDGNLVTWQQVMEDLVAQGKTEGDDAIYGFSYEDMIDGGAGNDYLFGGNGNDIFIYGNGYSNDVIHEGAENILGGMTDTVRFNADVLPEDVTFTRLGSTPDLLITLASGETLKVEGQFDAFASGPFGTLWFNRIEYFEFTSTGAVMTAEDVIQRVLTEAKTTGDDQIYGYFREDVLDGGAGDDYLAGGAEGDTYIFGHGYGHDVVLDQDGILGDGDNIDEVVFAADVSPSDLQVSRPVGTNDLVFTIASTGDTLTIKEELDKPASFANFNLVEEFRFADGTIWTADDIRPRLLAEAKTAGNDTIVGFYTADLLDGGAGNDLLQGAGGGDTYVWGRGYGQDTIDSYIVYITRDQPDTLEFTSDVLPSDLHLSRVGDDFILTIDGTTDQLTIKTQFSGLGYWTIENFHFANGTTWTWQDVQVLLLGGTSGDDFINGYDSTGDTLDGGAGNDLLIGGGGHDTYVFGRGYDRDTINDDNPNPFTDAPDRVLFNADTALADLEFVKVGTTDLVIRINGTEDELTIQGQYFSNLEITNFEFASGTVLTFADVQAIIAQNGPGHITHRGTAAAETINGSSADDVIDGRGGADTLRGGTGSDVYLFGAGSGNDAIQETGLNSETDIVELNGLNPADVTVSRVDQDLTIKINATGETLTVAGHFYSPHDGIEQIAFANGTTWDRATIFSNAWIRGTSGNDTINGTFDADQIDGGPGNDTMNGGASGDTYFYGVGSGNDSIAEGSDSSATDTIKLVDLNPSDILLNRNGQDLILSINATGETLTIVGHFWGTFNGIEQIAFANGTIWDRQAITENFWIRGTSGNDVLNGTSDADTIDGLGGNDTLNGSGNSDTYIFYAGSGNDTIVGETDSSAIDTIKLVGLNPADVTLTRSGQDLIVAINATGEKITVIGHFWGTRDGIELIAFEDGTTWDRAVIQNKAWFRGTSGNDTINGSGEQDTIDGGPGNDTLNGGGESDTYIFGIGSGNDTISGETDSGATDVIKLVGLNPADVTLTRSGQDLIVAINATGEKITVVGHFWGTRDGIEQLAFADGTIWDRAIIQNKAWFRGTSGNDAINGSGEQDTIDGGPGNDTLNGGGESDTYIFGVGSGNDTISGETDSGATDVIKLVGLNPADVTLTRSGQDLIVAINSSGETITVIGHYWGTRDGIEQIVFADGTTWDRTAIQTNAWIRGTSSSETLNGTGDPDTLDGLGGNDTLNGGAGGDTYIYRAGSGNDTIAEASDSGATDTIRLVGLNAADVTLARNGNDLLVVVNASGEQLTVSGHFFGTFNGIEQIVFADGTTWDRARIATEAPVIGTSGNDSMYGTSSDDSFLGALGNDYLEGHEGNDTYVFRPGDGQDTVADWGSGSDVDVLKFAAGILPSNVSVTEINGNDIRLWIGASDSVTLGYQLAGVWGGVDQVRFNDGTVWDRATLLAKATVPTANGDTFYGDFTGNTLFGGGGNDSLLGRDGNDQLSGDAGNDYLEGGVGNDTYLFNIGDGQDAVYDWGSGSDLDTVQFGAGINVGDVVVTQANGDVVLSIAGTSDSVSLKNQMGGTWAGADQVRFADGTIWDRATIFQKSIVPTSGNDSISGDGTANTLSGAAGNDNLYGREGDDQLSGDAGNDYLEGGVGNDTYLFNLGDGQDRIFDWGSNSDVDTVQFGAGITTGNVTVTLTGFGSDLLLSINGTSDSVLLDDRVSGAYAGADQVRFNDGTIWDYNTLYFKATHHAPTGAPTISGTAAEDQTLTANTSSIQDLDGLGTFHYQWQRSTNGGANWSNVGTDQATYALGDADVGSIVRVAVNYTDGGGTAESVTSSATGAVANVNHAPVGVNDSKAVNENAVATGSVLTNDTDADSGDTLRVSNVSNTTSGSQSVPSGGNTNLAGVYGTLILNSNGSYSYSPNNAAALELLPGQNVSDVFTYTVADPSNASANATLTFNITGVANTFTGTAGDDTLTGTAGPDTLDGQGGNDVLIGGAGADTLIGGTGTDTASYATAPAAVVANLATPASNTGHAAGDTYNGVENLTGSAFNDTLTGDANANTLDGGAGNDALDGGTGNDILIGGAGADIAQRQHRHRYGELCDGRGRRGGEPDDACEQYRRCGGRHLYGDREPDRQRLRRYSYRQQQRERTRRWRGRRYPDRRRGRRCPDRRQRRRHRKLFGLYGGGDGQLGDTGEQHRRRRRRHVLRHRERHRRLRSRQHHRRCKCQRAERRSGQRHS